MEHLGFGLSVGVFSALLSPQCQNKLIKLLFRLNPERPGRRGGFEPASIPALQLLVASGSSNHSLRKLVMTQGLHCLFYIYLVSALLGFSRSDFDHYESVLF